MTAPRFLEVCSGVGFMTRGLYASGLEPAALCEIDPWRRARLAEQFPGIPIFEDMTRITADDLRALGPLFLIAAGIPCQPWSCAGPRTGTDDHRDLWPAMRAIVAAARPRAVLVENVPGFDDRDDVGEPRARSDLAALGYASERLDVPAAGVGAPILRRRIFVLAFARQERRPELGTAHDHDWGDAPGNNADRCGASGVAGASVGGRETGLGFQPERSGQPNAAGGGRMGGADRSIPEPSTDRVRVAEGATRPCGHPADGPSPLRFWDGAQWIVCREPDRTVARRVEPGLRLLVDGRSVRDRSRWIAAIGDAGAPPQLIERIARAMLHGATGHALVGEAA